MKITLAGALNYYAQGRRYQPSVPLGLLALAAFVERDGHAVTVVDPNLAVEDATVRRDSRLYESLADVLLAGEPDVIGFSTLGNSYHQSLRLAEAARRASAHHLTVFGGPQATVVDEATLESYPAIDVIVRGEGELTFADLLGRLEAGADLAGTPGTTARSRGAARRGADRELITDLDALPRPAYRLYPMRPESGVPLDVGRGCPFDCSFCSTCRFWKRRWRLKSTGRILDEIAALRVELDTEVFSIPHDLFTVDKRRILEFCSALSKQEFRILWTCFGRIDCMDAEMLSALRSAGCISVGYGVESGSESVQRAIGKNLRPGRVVEVVSSTIEAGMSVVASFIVGFPEERPEDLRATARLIRDLVRSGRRKVHVGCSTLIPYGGSRLYEEHARTLAWAGLRPLPMPGTPFDEASLAMLEGNPALFSAFHRIPSAHLSRETLEELAEFLALPLQVAPATCLALWEELDDPMELFDEWRRFNARRRRPYTVDLHRGDDNRRFAVAYLRFVEAMGDAGKITPPSLAELALHETLKTVLRAGQSRRPGAAPGEAPFEAGRLPRLFPRATRAVVLKTFNYDVLTAESSLLDSGAFRTLEGRPCTIAYNRGFEGIVLAERLDARECALLRDCRGERTAAELATVHRALPAGSTAEDLLTKWYFQRMIVFETGE